MFRKKNRKRSSRLRKKLKHTREEHTQNPIIALLYAMQEKIQEGSASPTTLMEELHAKLDQCFSEKDDLVLSDAIVQLELDGKDSLAFWLKWSLDDLVQKGEGDFGERGKLAVYLFGIPVLLKVSVGEVLVNPIPVGIRNVLTHLIEEAPFLPQQTKVALSPFWVDGSYGGFPWSQMREVLYLLSDIIAGDDVENLETIVRKIGFGGESETLFGSDLDPEEGSVVAIRFLMGALAVPVAQMDVKKEREEKSAEDEGGIHSFPISFENAQYLEWAHEVSRTIDHDEKIDQVLVLSPPSILSDSIFQGYMTFKSLDFNNDLHSILERADSGEQPQCTYVVVDSAEGEGREIRIGIFDGTGVFLKGHIWPLEFWESEEDGVILVKEILAGMERFRIWENSGSVLLMENSTEDGFFLRPPSDG